MSLENLRNSAANLSAVLNEDNLVSERNAYRDENEELKRTIEQLQNKLINVEGEKKVSDSRVQRTDNEVRIQAETLAAQEIRRWNNEVKPGVISSEVQAEIQKYPYKCSAQTRKIIDDKVKMVVSMNQYERVASATNAIIDAARAYNEGLEEVRLESLPVVHVTLKRQDGGHKRSNIF
jgi:predicted nuclease with TOPRIM domain